MKSSILLLLVLCSCVSAQADWEWKGHGNRWCLIYERKKMCLPSDYGALEIGIDYIKFKRELSSEPSRFAEFHLTADWTRGEPVTEDTYILNREYESKNTVTSEYRSNTASGIHHDLGLVVIVFDGEFTIVLYGQEIEPMNDLAIDLAKQWNNKSVE